MIDRSETTHPDEGALMAWLDGELGETERRDLQIHVAACEACAARRDALRFAGRAAAAALDEVDAAPPWDGMPDALREAARAAPVPIDRGRRGGGATRSGRRAVAMAAGLVLVLAAGAYAIPGSPIRGWVDDSIEALAALVGVGEPAETPAPTAGPSSVAVEPVDGAVRVSLFDPPDGLRLSVSLSRGGPAEASAEDANIRVGSGWIEVRDLRGGPLRVTLPASADARIDVDGATLVRVVDGALVRTPEADRASVTIVFDADG